jgi:hypothetical protein
VVRKGRIPARSDSSKTTPLPGAPAPKPRVSLDLCYLVCDRAHCRHNRCCLHEIAIGSRENMHWFMRVIHEYQPRPVPEHVLYVERAAAGKAERRVEPASPAPENDSTC